MSSANSIQVGGDHYKSDYQHWDFCCDLALPYLPSASTKYITRYDKKNGEQDLQKAVHYLQKNTEQADSPANFYFWLAFRGEQSPKLGTRESTALLEDFLDSTFGKLDPAVKDERSRRILLAREAIYWQVYPYALLPTLSMAKSINGWGNFEAFAEAIRRFNSLSIKRVQELTALVYPPQETGEATPDYVNQDR